MKIRKATTNDTAEWARMREDLWPDSRHEHLSDIGNFFQKEEIDIVEVFVIERNSRKLGGFLELNLRSYAEGAMSTPVPYVEGWFIDADLRGRGYGKQLIQAAERWAIERDYQELGSDAELENTASIAAHKALGFMEVDRVVCFIKHLKVDINRD